jgi:hypothetical protein
VPIVQVNYKVVTNLMDLSAFGPSELKSGDKASHGPLVKVS